MSLIATSQRCTLYFVLYSMLKLLCIPWNNDPPIIFENYKPNCYMTHFSNLYPSHIFNMQKAPALKCRFFRKADRGGNKNCTGGSREGWNILMGEGGGEWGNFLWSPDNSLKMELTANWTKCLSLSTNEAPTPKPKFDIFFKILILLPAVLCIYC